MVRKLKVPFKFGETVGQDTDAEIWQCVEASVRTRPGDRIDRPEFGSSDQVFVQGGPDPEVMREAIVRDEPRAEVLVTVDASDLDDMVGRIRIEQQAPRG